MAEDAYVPTKIPKKVGIQVTPAASADGRLGGNAVKACKKKQMQTLNSVIFCDYIYLRMIVYMHIYI